MGTVLSKTSTFRMANISDKRGKHTLAIQKKEEIHQLVIDHIQKFRPRKSLPKGSRSK